MKQPIKSSQIERPPFPHRPLVLTIISSSGRGCRLGLVWAWVEQHMCTLSGACNSTTNRSPTKISLI